MKKLFILVSALILFTTQSMAAPVVGEVYQKMGTTWVERDFENITIEEAGFKLYMDDFLQTGEDGAMNLEFIDGTKFTVGPNGEAIIDEFRFDTSVVPIEVSMSVDVNVGSFTYESGSVSKLGGEVEINTPSATVTVIGTAFSGRVETSGRTTITLLPDRNGNVGQVTVANEAGSSTITQAYSAVIVVSDILMPTLPDPLSSKDKKELFDLDTNEETIEEKIEEQSDRRNEVKKIEQIDDKETKEIDQVEEKEIEKLEVQEEVDSELDNFDVQEENVEIEIKKVDVDTIEVTEEVAQELEQDLLVADTIEQAVEVMPEAVEEIKKVEVIEIKPEVVEEVKQEVVEDVIMDDTVTEIDTSYYDQWDDAAYDEEYGWVDENDQVTVWDASGEVKMDYEESKEMWAEMDKAYYDAIGCESDCTWENINWEEIDWDAIDWEEYDKKYNETLEKYGLEAYNWDDVDVTDDVFEEVEDISDYDEDNKDTWDAEDWENYNYYEDEDGPYLITGKEDWCVDADWCDQEYVDNSNEWAQADWDLNTKYDKWNKESKNLFEISYLNEKWYGDTTNAPKPWTITELKDKYIKDWTWDDWDIWWKAFDEWYFSDYYDNWEQEYEEVTIEEEYGFEDDIYDEDWELDWLADIDTEWDCETFGYYWDKKNSSCGTEWVDNSQVDIKVTSSGAELNYELGTIKQIVTTTENGVTTTIQQDGRYSTLENSADVNASTGSSNWKEITRTYNGHTVHIHTGGSGVASGNHSALNFDVMIIQDDEAQAMSSGENGGTITIIQID